MYTQVIKTACIVIITFYFVNNNISAQKSKKKFPPESIQIPVTVQITSKTDSLFAEYDNEINIKIPAPVNIYEIAISQGAIRNYYDKATSISGLNILSNLKTGNVTITIYCNKNGKKLIAIQRTFGVKEKLLPQYPRRITKNLAIQPTISISGYDSIITINALRNANKLDINMPYKILKYSFVFGTDIVRFESSTSHYFNSNILDILKNWQVGFPLLFDEIYIEDADGFIYRYPPFIFKVIADDIK